MTIFSINLTGNPNSCVIKINKQRIRSLVDSGAACSLMHRKVYDRLKSPPKISKKVTVNLQGVNGHLLTVHGSIEIPIQIGGEKVRQTFYIVSDINRNIILGQDFLRDKGVRLYYDLNCLRIGKSYIPFEEDLQIASLVRLTTDQIIKPQSSCVCNGKIRSNPDLPPNIYQICEVDKGYLSHEPGLTLTNSVVKITNEGKFPVMIVNNTNKTFRLRRGCVVGKAECLPSENIVSMSSQAAEIDEISESDLLADVNVPPEHKERVLKLLSDNSDIFAQKDTQLGQTSTLLFSIDTGDAKPIKLRPYRTPLNNRKILDNALDEMLEAKIIERSNSPWSFPCVLVKKKDGTRRFCIDFRQLNKVTKSNSFPLPVIDDILAQLGGAKYFTTLDLKSGYWQVKMDPKDKEKVAFTCHRGLFQFLTMPFGVLNGPSKFQELMTIVLQDCTDFAIAYLDDIIIFSPTLEKHFEHVRMVFDCLRQHQLKLKLKKCTFLQQETNYLGFVVSEKGIKPDPEKVKSIRALPAPTCVRDVRSFIGLYSYYRRFIPSFSAIAEPLIKLTRKYSKFKWSADAEQSFNYLKASLTAIPMLGFPEINSPYILYTDASNDCIGAVLVQSCEEKDSILPEVPNEKPIYFLSHKLSSSQQKWSTIEKEAFAVKYALEKMNCFLDGSKFIIRCDHEPLVHIINKPSMSNNKKLATWSLYISAYDCELQYIRGVKNTCADMLSRISHVDEEADTGPLKQEDAHDHTLQINCINTNQIDPRQFINAQTPVNNHVERPVLNKTDINMSHEQMKDDELRRIKEQLLNNEASKTTYTKYLVMDDILYYLSNRDDDPLIRLCIPEHLRQAIIVEFHDQLGHQGMDKVYDNVRLKYYWPNLYKYIHEYVSRCVTCQQHSQQNTKASVEIPDIPPYPFSVIAMDTSGPYPLSRSGNRFIVAFIDLYSGYPEAFAVPDKSAETVVQLLLDEIYVRYSCPLTLISDRGTEYCNKIMQETLNALNIGHIRTSPYHPQANGMIERFNKSLNSIMTKRLNDHLNTWDVHLPQALAPIRFSVSESRNFSPFAILFGRDPTLPLDNLLKPRRKYLGEEHHLITLEKSHESFRIIHQNLKRAKQRQAGYANRKAKDVNFKVGDPIFLKNNRRRSKLESRWIPYYRIIRKTGEHNFEIRSQLDGAVTKVHSNNIRPANITDWSIPKDDDGRPLRRAAYVVPPDSSSSDDEDMQTDERPGSNDSHSADDLNGSSSSETDPDDAIPLAELAKRLRRRKPNLVEKSQNSKPMEIDTTEVSSIPPQSASTSDKSKDQSNKLKTLLQAMAELM